MRKTIKEYSVLLIGLLIVSILSYIKIPYNIRTTGGLMNINDKITFDTPYEQTGSFNMAYVHERDGTLLNCIFSIFDKHAEFVKAEQSSKDDVTANKILLNNANEVAVITAYEQAGEEIEFDNIRYYITYILDSKTNNLKVGDEVLKINGIEISKGEEVSNFIRNAEIGTKVDVEIKRNKKIITKKATIIEYKGFSTLGLVLTTNFDIKSEINFNFQKNEYGPSGGLMMTLAIYNSLTEFDLTQGRKIAGTGTIEPDGTIGEIGGIKHKIRGAYKEGAKIFLVPPENYLEALEVIEEDNYDMELIQVANIEEAIEYLKK